MSWLDRILYVMAGVALATAASAFDAGLTLWGVAMLVIAAVNVAAAEA